MVSSLVLLVCIRKKLELTEVQNIGQRSRLSKHYKVGRIPNKEYFSHIHIQLETSKHFCNVHMSLKILKIENFSTRLLIHCSSTSIAVR